MAAMVMNRVRARFSFLVFDVDGTIVDNTQMIVSIFQELFLKFGHLTYSSEEIIRRFGPPEEEIISREISEARREAIEYYLREYERRHPLTGFLSPMDFRSLRAAGFGLGIFTGKGRTSLSITLRKMRLENAFDIIVTGSDVPRSKPHPDGLNLILQKVDVRQEKALYIGDSPEDVLMARAAGITIAGAMWGAIDKNALRASHPEYLFEEPASLIRWLVSGR